MRIMTGMKQPGDTRTVWDGTLHGLDGSLVLYYPAELAVVEDVEGRGPYPALNIKATATLDGQAFGPYTLSFAIWPSDEIEPVWIGPTDVRASRILEHCLPLLCAEQNRYWGAIGSYVHHMR